MLPDDKQVEIAAVRLLARREHSSEELRRKLQRRRFADDAIDRVLEKLKGKRLVSDDRFVTSFVQHHSRRGQGPVRIRAELRQQGLSDELIGQALAGANVDWAALAAETRARKFGKTPPNTLNERAKQARFLQYRGFDADQVRAALRQANTDIGDHPFDLGDPQID